MILRSPNFVSLELTKNACVCCTWCILGNFVVIFTTTGIAQPNVEQYCRLGVGHTLSSGCIGTRQGEVTHARRIWKRLPACSTRFPFDSFATASDLLLYDFGTYFACVCVRRECMPLVGGIHRLPQHSRPLIGVTIHRRGMPLPTIHRRGGLNTWALPTIHRRGVAPIFTKFHLSPLLPLSVEKRDLFPCRP